MKSDISLLPQASGVGEVLNISPEILNVSTDGNKLLKLGDVNFSRYSNVVITGKKHLCKLTLTQV